MTTTTFIIAPTYMSRDSIARLADHHARNAGENEFSMFRNQQPDRIGTICA